MNLPRHTLSSSVPSPAFVSAHFCAAAESSRQGALGAGAAPPLASAAGAPGAREPALASSSHASGQDADGATNLFACATSSGFFVAQAAPLKIVARRDFPAAHGGLSHAAAVDDSSLLVLVGGGRVPRFAPNKVVLWDEAAEVVASRKPPEAAYAPPSPRASTVFSVGSGFDRESVTSRVQTTQSAAPVRQDDGQTPDRLTDAERRIQDWRHTAGGRRSSEKGKARALDLSDLEHDNTRITASDASPAASLASSRLSVASSASAHELSQSLFDRDAFASSEDEGSIAASSAGLDDPFSASPPRHRSPAVTRTPYEEAPPTAHAQPESQSPPVQSHSPRLPLSPVDNVVRADRHDNVNDLDRPVTAPRRGREVAELEFAEAVTGVCVRSFKVPGQASEKEAAAKTPDDARRKPTFGDGAALRDRARTDRAVIMAVLLRKRAVVFELVPGTEAGASLEIHQRALTEMNEQGAGLAALAPFPGRSSALLALPGRQAGHVQLLRIPLRSSRSSAAGATSILAAHSAPLAALCLSPCGTLLATASKRGTLVRIWSTVKPASNGSGRPQVVATLLRELRRGTDPARILSMTFAPDCSSIAAASEKGTVHIFNLTAAAGMPSGGARPPSSPASGAFGLSKGANRFLPAALSDIASAIPASMMPRYFQSTWSVAQYRIPLRSFSAQGAAALTRPTRTKKGSSADASSAAPVGGGGARSTEGAWATMLGRVDDVRRGEPGAEERIFLAWVRAPIAPDAKTSGSSASRTSRREAPPPVAAATQGGAFHLLALTTSGGYYRISLNDDARSETPPRASSSEDLGDDASSSAVLDMYREDEAAGAAAAARRKARQAPEQKGCHLEEFRTFGAAESDWS